VFVVSIHVNKPVTCTCSKYGLGVHFSDNDVASIHTGPVRNEFIGSVVAPRNSETNFNYG
jgi:hypothetical protein